MKNNLTVNKLKYFPYFTFGTNLITYNGTKFLPENSLIHSVRDIDSIAKRINLSEFHINTNNLYVGSEDVNQMASEISKKIEYKIKKVLENRVKLLELFKFSEIFEKIYDFFIQKLNFFQIHHSEYKIWIFKEKTLVLDLYLQKNCYTIEFTIDDDNNINGFVFLRRGQDLTFLEKYNQHLGKKNKANQKFEILSLQKIRNDLQAEINSSIEFFLQLALFQYLQSRYKNDEEILTTNS